MRDEPKKRLIKNEFLIYENPSFSILSDGDIRPPTLYP
jgi:hypothetical protein